MAEGGEQAAALALRLIDGAPAAPAVAEVGWLALARALKDAALAAWSSDPPRAARAAVRLRALAAQAPEAGEAGGAGPRAEIAALADWAGGIAALAEGRMQPAADLFDAAAAQLRRLGQPAAAALAQVPKIAALSMLGRHDEATACGEALLATFVAEGDSQAAGKVSLNLGSLLLRRDDYARAAGHYRQAAVRFARAGDRRHSVMADIGLADTLAAMGEFDEALRYCERAARRAAVHDLPLLEAMTDESAALVHLVRGSDRAALAGLERARRRYEALALPQYLAVAEKQLADAYLALSLLPEAVALYRTALQRFEALALPDEQAWALLQIGRALARQGQGTEADAPWREADTPWREADTPWREAETRWREAESLFATQGNAVGGAQVALARAEGALAAGQARAACRLARRASAAFGEAGLAEGALRADTLAGHALARRRRWAAAGALFERTLARTRELGLHPLQAGVLTGLGLVAAARGDRAAADGAWREAIAQFEARQRALPDGSLRSALLGLHLQPYQERLRLALADGDAATVLRRLDRFRARSQVADGGAEATDATTRDLRARVLWQQRLVRQLEDEGGEAGRAREALRAAEERLLEHLRRRRLAGDGPLPAAAEAAGAGPAAGDAAAGDAAAGDEVDVAALQARLGPGDALVEYGVLDDELFAVVLAPGGPRLVRRLAAWPEVLQALASLRFQTDALRHGLAPVRAHLPRLAARAHAHLQRLHRLLWAPLRPALDGAARVLVVPHGPLAGAPLAALADEAGSELVDRHALALVPSARAAARLLQRMPRPPRRALVLGESSRLPHAGREAQAVAALFAEGRCAVGEAASLRTLQAEAAGADLIHLACHAEFRADSPLFSALHLHDEPLTVEAAMALRLRPATVVLSACETALADGGAADDAVGLVSAFLAGGAARVLASLWPVDDEVTAGLMLDFHRALQAGAGTAEALRAAQRATRARHPHPALWGGFVLHGGW